MSCAILKFFILSSVYDRHYAGVKLWACKLAMEMFHYTKEDMFADMDGILTVGDFYKQGSGIGTHMLFI